MTKYSQRDVHNLMNYDLVNKQQDMANNPWLENVINKELVLSKTSWLTTYTCNFYLHNKFLRLFLSTAQSELI